ncbi:hypothetical protein L6164_036012 [Bauhinia variegata]|uniref:Uncharacterized protein n=1 Tax=Bauhinia variegata TaxID=167791 RepID=A0ACB9KGI6_BAUVA|nr:hypothetical protein L6164_036012 [Bauhinia variegata]
MRLSLLSALKTLSSEESLPQSSTLVLGPTESEVCVPFTGTPISVVFVLHVFLSSVLCCFINPSLGWFEGYGWV